MTQSYLKDLLCYQVHMGKVGWLSAKRIGEIAGNKRLSLDIQAIKIKSVYKVFYSVYSKENGWSEEKSNNQMAGSVGKAVSLSRIKIWMETSHKRRQIVYRIHGYNGKWSKWFRNGQCATLNDQPFNAIQIKIESNIGELPLNGIKNKESAWKIEMI